MGSDCTVKIDNGFLNVRVGAIIMKGDKFLMVGNENQDYYYSVGGRIQFGESAEDAIVREVFEETGVKMEIDRLGFIHENFFYGDSDFRRDKFVYEISFIFYMKVPEDFEPNGHSVTSENVEEKLYWVSSDCTTVCHPAFFLTELQNPKEGIQHIVTDDRYKRKID